MFLHHTSLYFQDSASPAMEGIIELHGTIMFYIILITTYYVEGHENAW